VSLVGVIYRHEETGQGLARTCRRGDKDIGATFYEGPGSLLWLGRALGEAAGEPGGYG
jgi:hypothetical protein